jgi:hypothetical protein
MARKKKRPKGTWFRALLLFVIGPILIWICGFFLWLYWDDLNRLLNPNEISRTGPQPAGPAKTKEDREHPVVPAPQERIFDEERKQLEEILKRRN